MVSISTKPEIGRRFVFPFQGEDVLWEIRGNLGDNRWGCRIVNGVFMGRHYESLYHGQEAVFHSGHLSVCLAADDMSAVVSDAGEAREKEKVCRLAPSGSSGTVVTEPSP